MTGRSVVVSGGVLLLLMSCAVHPAKLPIEYGPVPVGVCFFTHRSVVPEPSCKSSLKHMFFVPALWGPHDYVALSGYRAPDEVGSDDYAELTIRREKAVSSLLMSLGLSQTSISCALENTKSDLRLAGSINSKDGRVEASQSHSVRHACPWQN